MCERKEWMRPNYFTPDDHLWGTANNKWVIWLNVERLRLARGGGGWASMMMMLGFGHRNSLFSVLDCRSLLFCHRTNGLPFNGLGAKLTLALAQVASDIRVSVNHLSSTSSIWAETKSILCRFLLLSFRDIFSLRPFAPRLPRQNGNSPLFTHCQLKFE